MQPQSEPCLKNIIRSVFVDLNGKVKRTEKNLAYDLDLLSLNSIKYKITQVTTVIV